MNPRLKRSLVFIIIALCLLSRLPQLLSTNLILDGDECVDGLMAKHIYSLKDFPLFFYGQAYGFSFIESLAIVPFYAIAGVTTLSVKIAMLCIWITGVVFLFKAFVKINNGNTSLPFLLILVLICSPAWAVWSMKARGGYLTAFMLTAIILYLLFSPSIKSTRYIIIGVLFTLVYQSQPLWIPGLIPLIVCRLYREKSVKNALLFTITAMIFLIFFYFYKQGLPHDYTPDLTFECAQLASHVARIPYFLFSSLHGYYFSNRVQHPNFFCALFAYVFAAIIFFLILVAIVNLVARKKGSALFNLSVLSVILTLCCTLFFKDVHPRYLLPITGYTLLSLLLLLQTAGKQVFYFVAPVLIVGGSLSLVSFKDFRFSTMQKSKFGQLIPYLLTNKVHYVYCYDRMLTYQLLFYSKEQIIARDRPLITRFPVYSQQVDSALNNGQKTAFIFNELQLRDMVQQAISFNGYLIIFDPKKTDLAKIFRF